MPNASRIFIKLVAIPLLALALSLSGASATEKAKKPRQTIAHSLVSPNYQRERLESGGWKKETYALAIGKPLDPTRSDSSLTALSVEEMAEILAKALDRQDYVAESNPEKTDLMIVVNWGKTIPFNDGLKQQALDGLNSSFNQIDGLDLDFERGGSVTFSSTPAEAELENLLTIQSMADRARRQANDYNAKLLGFAPDLAEHYADDTLGGPQRLIYDDLVAEIEAPRYFVILVAYDFHKLVEKKEKDVLWITRFSMRAQGRSFNEELANMARSASQFFGKRSGKIRRNLLPGEIKMGELEVIEHIPESEQ